LHTARTLAVLLTLAVVALVGGTASSAQASPGVPTSSCDVAELLGVKYVKECEGAPTS
jgi:hypothetical protein